MANKIKEIIIEPSKVYAGSNFKLKVKAITYLTYKELKTKKYSEIKLFTYKDLKGE